MLLMIYTKKERKESFVCLVVEVECMLVGMPFKLVSLEKYLWSIRA
jgi:hypothetical protein